MTGRVDDSLRALLPVALSAAAEEPTHELEAWVDTAFNGVLTLPRRVVEQLSLGQSATTEAVLADGTIVALESYRCTITWFGSNYETHIVAGDSQFPLIGTMLLDGRYLSMDYGAKTVTLS